MADTTNLQNFFSDTFDSFPEPDAVKEEDSLDMNLIKLHGTQAELAAAACPHGYVKVDGYCVKVLGRPESTAERLVPEKAGAVGS